MCGRGGSSGPNGSGELSPIAPGARLRPTGARAGAGAPPAEAGAGRPARAAKGARRPGGQHPFDDGDPRDGEPCGSDAGAGAARGPARLGQGPPRPGAARGVAPPRWAVLAGELRRPVGAAARGRAVRLRAGCAARRGRVRSGLIEQADGGTLYLQEVGRLPPSLQLKLLEVLQGGTLERLGGGPLRRVDVRVIASSQRGLRGLVEAGSFREDLFYRLAVVSSTLPPLRARRDDLPALVAHFVAEANRALDKSVRGVMPGALSAIFSYEWPGNVRELKNALWRAVAAALRQELSLTDLPPTIRGARAVAEAAPYVVPGATMEEIRARGDPAGARPVWRFDLAGGAAPGRVGSEGAVPAQGLPGRGGEPDWLERPGLEVCGTRCKGVLLAVCTLNGRKASTWNQGEFQL